MTAEGSAEPTPDRPGRRGRRPAGSDTRAQILTAARESFARLGFARATMRGIAKDAGVDAALVHHYFGSKDDLFLAALALPVDPRTLLAPVVAGGLDGAAERILRVFISTWDNPETRLPLLTLVRGAFEPEGRSVLAEGIVPVVLAPLGRALGVEDPDRRMALVASQMIGLIVMRYVVMLEPLASMSADDLVASYAPTLQRYLDGDLSA